MATMNISVPDPMKDWVQSQVDKGSYANTRKNKSSHP